MRRSAGPASYELPFGRGERFLSDGGIRAALASNWLFSGTWEYQPGALLDWARAPRGPQPQDEGNATLGSGIRAPLKPEA